MDTESGNPFIRQSAVQMLNGMNVKEYKHSEVTGKIIGAATQLHSTLGNGFQEVIYQGALVIEQIRHLLNPIICLT